jgi:hypothetical protein
MLYFFLAIMTIGSFWLGAMVMALCASSKIREANSLIDENARLHQELAEARRARFGVVA